jgi:uncharacterized membrane protein YidH (DUF202 family)
VSTPPSERSIDWDEGVASERTVLAWERTAIATLAVAALALRAGVVHHELTVGIPATVLLVVAAVAEWMFGRHIYDEHDRPLDQGAALHDRAIVAIGAVTLFASAASIPLAFGT